ncbi:MAG: GNAT family N-acetyltransferase [Roseovarius sp.]|nr:GNAT family N-acetyltransferase [Roseovarius sp.]MCY4209075.1 GNAT family N-acetyltransferase [Roseovarius sp.]MCY4290592.1 GNAT family N-acetyltransferase [Roseovarius sp.]
MRLAVVATDDLPTCVGLRRSVFIEELGVPEHIEQDGRDEDAHHLIAFRNDVPVGTARMLVEGRTGKIGRVCVLSEFRGKGTGAALMNACIDHLKGIGMSKAVLGALVTEIEFYKALGFTPFGTEFDDAGGLPHINMERML